MYSQEIHKYFIFGIDKDIAGVLVSLRLEFSSWVFPLFYHVEISKDFVVIGREFSFTDQCLHDKKFFLVILKLISVVFV